MAERLRILIADDHPLIRSGIRATLIDAPDIEVIAEAEEGHEMQRLCERHQPDVLIMDIGMPGPNFNDRVAFVKNLGVKVLVLSAYDDTVYVQAMFRAGVEGYILKDELADTLLTALRAVAGGGTYFSRRILSKLHAFDFESSALASLTPRERDVLALLVKGLDNAQIAEELSLADQTVRNYVSRLYEKTGLNSRVELAVWALKHQLVDEGSSG